MQLVTDVRARDVQVPGGAQLGAGLKTGLLVLSLICESLIAVLEVLVCY